MTTGYILIAAILILGGVIATVGDRLGTRIGKARLRLFNLRPRQTAVVMTIVTGSLISASTLAILFAVDERLWTGVFELERIQKNLRKAREKLETTSQQLNTTSIQKSQVEQELAQSRAEQKAEQKEAQRRQEKAQKRLEEINKFLQEAIAKQSQTQNQLSQITSQFQQAQARLRTVTQQARTLRSEVKQRQAELQKLSRQRQQLKAQIVQRDRDIAERDQVIARRATRLKALVQQQKYLEREVAKLERSYQVLRLGNVAIERGEVLAAAVVRIVQPTAARQAVNQLLSQANRNAIQLTQPGTKPENKEVLLITQEQVEQLIARIKDGRDYVVRIRSTRNYILGEKYVEVFVDLALNQVVFSSGSVLASISADPSIMTAGEIQRRVDLLLGASRFRAQSAGMLSEQIQIGDGSLETLIRFIDQLKQYNQSVQLKALAAQDTYTSGPLKVQLVAMHNNKVIFGTQNNSRDMRGNLNPMPATQPNVDNSQSK